MFEIYVYVDSELIEEEEGIRGRKKAKAMLEYKGRTLSGLYAHKRILNFNIVVFEGDNAVMTLTGPATQTLEEQNIENVTFWER